MIPLLLACTSALQDRAPARERSAAFTGDYYTLFILNVHDWVFADESAEAVERVLDIHEELGVRVDVYVTDPVLQGWLVEAPYLIDRLRSSDVAAVSYHLRPPHPHYDGFDWLGLSDMEAEDRYQTIARYEEHAIDLETGQTRIEPGGYTLLGELMGYPPPSVGIGSLMETTSRIYSERGATFGVDHSEDVIELGETKNALYIRPEHVAIELYDWSDDTDACPVLSGEIASFEQDSGVPTGAAFVAIKWHENNFYTDSSPWKPIYFVNGDTEQPRDPPWDPRAFEGEVAVVNTLFQEQRWDLYTSAVRCVAENSEHYTSINTMDLIDMLP